MPISPASGAHRLSEGVPMLDDVLDIAHGILDRHVTPHLDHSPSCSDQGTVHLIVAFAVPHQLGSPVARVHTRRAALKDASVPPGPVHEHCDPGSWGHGVRANPPSEDLHLEVRPGSRTRSTGSRPEQQLRSSVHATDRAYAPRPSRSRPPQSLRSRHGHGADSTRGVTSLAIIDREDTYRPSSAEEPRT